MDFSKHKCFFKQNIIFQNRRFLQIKLSSFKLFVVSNKDSHFLRIKSATAIYNICMFA